MNTKHYTSIKQSKRLLKLGLNPESADMCLTFVNNVWNPVWGKADDIYQFQKDCYEPDYTKDDYIDIDEFEPKVVPCWSLGALLEIMPTGAHIEKRNNNYACYTVYNTPYKEDAPIDAAYYMVVWLLENGFIKTEKK